MVVEESRNSSVRVSNWHHPSPLAFSLPASALHLYSFLPSPEMPLQFSCDRVFVLTHYDFVCWFCHASLTSLLWALIGGCSTVCTHPKGKTSPSRPRERRLGAVLSGVQGGLEGAVWGQGYAVASCGQPAKFPAVESCSLLSSLLLAVRRQVLL